MAEALTAWAVREETNLVNLVAEILEAAVNEGQGVRKPGGAVYESSSVS